MSFDKNIAKVQKQVDAQKRGGVRAYASTTLAMLLMGTMAFAGGIGQGMWGRGGGSSGGLTLAQVVAGTGWSSNGTTTTTTQNVQVTNAGGVKINASGLVPIQLVTAQYLSFNASNSVTLRDSAGNLEAGETIVPSSTGTVDLGSTGLNWRGLWVSSFLSFNSKLTDSGTAPTISSGFGTSPSISANNGTPSFRINVGTGGVATTGVIGLPAATTGWNCDCEDITTTSATVARCKQTGAGTTTTVPIGNFTTGAIAGAWVASDILVVKCRAY